MQMRTRRKLLSAAGGAALGFSSVAAAQEGREGPDVTFHDCHQFTVDYEGQYQLKLDAYYMIEDGEATSKPMFFGEACEETFDIRESDMFADYEPVSGPVTQSVLVEYWMEGEYRTERFSNPYYSECEEEIVQEWRDWQDGSDPNGDGDGSDPNGDDPNGNGDDGNGNDGSNGDTNDNDGNSSDQMNGFGVGAAITAIGGVLGAKRYLSRRDSEGE